MPVVFGQNDTKTIPICCGEEMKVAGRWFHCFKCGLKLIQNKRDEKSIVRELLFDVIRDEEIMWKDFHHAMHQIWRDSMYGDDYHFEIPKEWI